MRPDPPTRALADALIGTYVDWREEAEAARAAYRRWATGGRPQDPLAFLAYRAALEREEAAAAAYGSAVALAGARPVGLAGQL